MEKKPIEIIFVRPKNLKYCEYVINDGMTHAKKYEELYKYLGNLYPDLKFQIYNLISLKRYFFIFPQENKIQELEFDYFKEMGTMKKNLLNLNIQKISNEQKEKKSFLEESDQNLKIISDKRMK